MCGVALNVQHFGSVGVRGAYRAAQFEGNLLLFCAGASWHVVTVGQADELGDESEALLAVDDGGAPISVERQTDAFGQLIEGGVDLPAGEVFRRVPRGRNSLPVGLGAPKMEALVAREGMAKFSIEGEDDGHAFAAPFAAPFKILFDLAGDALFFVALALCGGGWAREFAETII